ncbi:MAG TPA: helix-turn-helix domain-containing protein [Vicinamibacterales bacterium]|nr:helix-turn-helix domain-containing protein [Vicinamibacterales bacterium]
MPRRARCLRTLDAPRDAAVHPDAASSGLAVVARDTAASALLHPIRRRVLVALQTPGSATSVAEGLGLSRQVVNYHVRALERAGLLEEVARRQRRGLQERIVRAAASWYLISPDALGGLGDTPADVTDRFSATYQVAVAARTIREVAALAALAREAGKRLTTMTLDAEVRLATPAAREAFGNELADAVMKIVARYHDERAPDGRTYRLFAGAHPIFHAPAPPPKPRRALRHRRRQQPEGGH